MNEKVLPPLYESLMVSDNISLRALTPEDAQRLFDLTVQNRVYLAEFLPWANNVDTANDSLAFIEETASKRASGSEFGFGIIVDGQVAGHTSLMHLQDEKDPEIGYWIAKSYSGKGIVTKTTDALTEFGLHILKLDRIIIRARLNNTGSNSIPPKLGYTLEGTTDDEDGTHNRWVKLRQQEQ